MYCFFCSNLYISVLGEVQFWEDSVDCDNQQVLKPSSQGQHQQDQVRKLDITLVVLVVCGVCVCVSACVRECVRVFVCVWKFDVWYHLMFTLYTMCAKQYMLLVIIVTSWWKEAHTKVLSDAFVTARFSYFHENMK